MRSPHPQSPWAFLLLTLTLKLCIEFINLFLRSFTSVLHWLLMKFFSVLKPSLLVLSEWSPQGNLGILGLPEPCLFPATSCSEKKMFMGRTEQPTESKDALVQQYIS